MEVNEDLALEVSPASVSARRASLHVSRSGSGLGVFGLGGSVPDISLLTQQLQQVPAVHSCACRILTIHAASFEACLSAGHCSMRAVRAQCGVCHPMQGVKLGAAEYADLLRAKWYKKEDGTTPGYHGERLGASEMCGRGGTACPEQHRFTHLR